jgi:long-chain acyl-CoA synthetase
LTVNGCLRREAPVSGPAHLMRRENEHVVLDSLYERLAEYPDRRLRLVSPVGTVEFKTFSQLHTDVTLLMSQLRGCGVAAGDLVGIMGPNSYAWIVADLALLTLDCVSVALPVENTEDHVDTGELAERYELSALLISKLLPIRGELSAETAFLEDRPVSLVRRQPTRRPKLPQGIFTIAFSSGTAGTKKGLMLSRAGVENTIETSARAWKLRHDDEILIVMPFSNLQQRYLMYLAIRCGAGAIVVSPERMFQKLKTLEPTIVLGPPSFFEIVENRIRASQHWAKIPYYVASALHAILPRASRPIRARLGRKWTGIYGSRIRLLLTGSAPVPPRLVEVFHRVGAPLYEVYGSTEVGWITFNLPEKYQIGTAGAPVEGVAVEIGADGEVVVRSAAAQAIGYIFEGVETQDSVFLADGKIATGDLGRFNYSGFLKLIGRKNNVLITRSGVKINPEELEHDIEQACPIEKAVVLGTVHGTTLSCVVWLHDDEDPHRRREVEMSIVRTNKRRGSSHQITKIIFRPACELTAKSGLLTRNLKINRAAVVREILPEDDHVRQ